jgi:uncharacterized DUF497 family protein
VKDGAKVWQGGCAKHGVTFGEASTVFQDALSVTIGDPLHSDDEDRFVLAEYFPDHDAVNESLRSLIAVIRRQSKPQGAAAKGSCS